MTMFMLLMHLIGLALGLIAIGLGELSYVLIKKYEVPGFYWPDIEEDDEIDV
jgi:hypothetical protein